MFLSKPFKNYLCFSQIKAEQNPIAGVVKRKSKLFRASIKVAETCCVLKFVLFRNARSLFVMNKKNQLTMLSEPLINSGLLR